MKPAGKRLMPVAAALAAMVLLSGCFRIATPASTPTPEAATAAPTTAPQESATATAVFSTPTAIAETPAPTPTPPPSPTPTPAGPRMYSSYADLVSFDPETGIAKFDYFDMLRGEEAAKYLVDHEGYTEAAAKALVDDFAESEYVKKNTNSQLRAIDLDDVSIKLMYQPSGDVVDDAQPVPSSADDFRAIYALDTSLLLETYFYYIHVGSDGRVSLVEQVFWP